MTDPLAEGVKFDGDKPRYDLIPPELLHEAALVLTYGAVKYTTEVINEWDALLRVQCARELLVSTPEGSVVAVTRNISDSPIPNMQNANVRTGGDGSSETKSASRSWQSVDELIRQHVRATSAPSGASPSTSTDSQRKNTPSYAVKGVPSAVPPNTCTLTIATARGSLEVSFAPGVTMDSVFWTIVWKGLNEHFGISRPQNRTGERNWEKGMKWGRVFGALMRHMWAWWRGQDRDPETGFSHLSHAACCIAFLIAYEHRCIGEDDRHKLGGRGGETP